MHYYPFGMLMPGRNVSASNYRYGFNGKEQDSAVNGTGVDYDYGFRIYDTRMGRFLSNDPLQKRYPYYTPYQFSGNTPIQAIDLDGLEPKGYSSGYQNLYKDLSVRTIPSRYDNQSLEGTIGNYKGIINAYAVQDIDKRTYVIYESVHGNRQWYIEYDKNGWKGNVNEFKWNKPKPVGKDIYWMVAPVVAVPALPVVVAAAPTVGSVAWTVWSNPYVQYAIGGDIASSYAYEYATSDEKAAAALASSPTTSPVNTKSKPETLDWSRVNPRTGETAPEHVDLHGQNDLQKKSSLHGIFYGDPVQTTDKAWAAKGNIQPIRQANGNDAYIIPYANAGYAGGIGGQRENLNYITIITEGGSNKVVTAFPSYNGLPVKY